VAAETNQKDSILAGQHSKSLNTAGAWTNREEEMFFANKRLLFSSKTSEVAD